MVKQNKGLEQDNKSLIRAHPGINRTKKIRYDDVPITYSPTPDAEMNQVNRQSVKEKALKFLSVKRRPKLVILLTYISIFMLGAALGFTPFIKIYIETCQEDRRIMNNIIEHFENVAGSMMDPKIENLMANMRIKTAYGIGNNKISMICNGKIKIVFIEYSGTKADKTTLNEFNSFCENNNTRDGASTSCDASIELVYGVPSVDKSAFTVIQYMCEHG